VNPVLLPDNTSPGSAGSEDWNLKMEGKSQRKEKITALVLFGFSLFYFFSCWHLKLGTASNPGPGFIPVVIGSLLLLCTASYLRRVFGTKFSERRTGDIAAGEAKNYRAIYGILACTAAYPFILEILRFLVSTSTAAFVMLILLKPQKPLFSFFLALGMAVASFLIFSRFLGVALPSGFLEELLFRIGG